MKRIFITVLYLIVSIGFLFSKEPDADRILNNGKMLFRLEKASWYGTDFFLENLKDKVDSIGGYISYINESNDVVNFFYNRYDSSKIIVRLTFNLISKQVPKLIDLQNKVASKMELDLISIRQDAKRQVSKNDDKFFIFYNNTSLNYIPVIVDKVKKVYILTGPKANGNVLIGNDYVLTYSKHNDFDKRERIHNSLISIPYSNKNDSNKIQITMHSHILSDFITETDICTLLLYRDYVEWDNHYVFSKDYVSMFDIRKETLAILRKDVFEKITKKK